MTSRDRREVSRCIDDMERAYRALSQQPAQTNEERIRRIDERAELWAEIALAAKEN